MSAVSDFKPLRLVVGGKSINRRLQLSFHHLGELMIRQSNAMIRDAVLREIVGANLLVAIAGADLASLLACAACCFSLSCSCKRARRTRIAFSRFLICDLSSCNHDVRSAYALSVRRNK